MRSQTFEGLNFVWVDVYSRIDGGLDEDGNEKSAQKRYFSQNRLVDLQPKSGSKRAAESGTVYESTHVIFHPVTQLPIPKGSIVDVRLESYGEVINQFEVVFPALYGDHYELDLRVVET